MVERLGQPGAVDRLHHPKAAFDELDLVGLQVADEVPVEIGWADLLDLGQGLLYPVFAKLCEPEPDRLTDPFDRQRLGDCHQHDLTRIAPGALRTAGDHLADAAEVCFQ